MSSDNTKIPQESPAVAQEIHERPAIAPAVDIYENETEFLLVADLPGVGQDDVKIDLHEGELSLVATRTASDTGEVLAWEFDPIDFRRKFRVSNVIDAGKISAKLVRGVLSVHLPKADGIKPRTINVRTG